MSRSTKNVSQPLTKRRMPRQLYYKRLPKGTTSHFEWQGNKFVEIFMINGFRYVKHFTPDNNTNFNHSN